jgi:phosphatidylglycerophosphatase A
MNGPPLRKPLSFWIATVGGVGRLPKAPGTWGSLAALPLAWLIASLGGPWALAAATLLASLLGWWAAADHAKRLGQDDPQEIVIDEVAGQWLILILVPPNLWLYAAGFALFRVLDIFKPWPAGWADRRIGGGLGIMLDDLLAALWGVLPLAALARLAVG